MNANEKATAYAVVLSAVGVGWVAVGTWMACGRPMPIPSSPEAKDGGVQVVNLPPSLHDRIFGARPDPANTGLAQVSAGQLGTSAFNCGAGLLLTFGAGGAPSCIAYPAAGDAGYNMLTLSTVAALEAQALGLLTTGSLAYVSGIYERYSLDLANSCTVDHFSCLATASGGTTRWLIDLGWVHPYWQTQTRLVIDPVGGNDSTGLATDAAPLKTWKRLWYAWGARRPTFNQSTILYFANDQPDMTDPVYVDFSLGPVGQFQLVGALQVLHTGTLTSGTHDRTVSADIAAVVEDTALPNDGGLVSGWAPYSETFLYNTTRNTMTPIAYSCGEPASLSLTDAALSPASYLCDGGPNPWANYLAKVGEPKPYMDAGCGICVGFGNPAAASQSGDSYQVVRGASIALAGWHSQTQASSPGSTNIGQSGAIDVTFKDMAAGINSALLTPLKIEGSNLQFSQDIFQNISHNIVGNQFDYMENDIFAGKGPVGGNDPIPQAPWINVSGGWEWYGGIVRNNAIFAVGHGNYGIGGHLDTGMVFGGGLVFMDGGFCWSNAASPFLGLNTPGGIEFMSEGSLAPSFNGGVAIFSNLNLWSDGIVQSPPYPGQAWLILLQPGTSIWGFHASTMFAQHEPLSKDIVWANGTDNACFNYNATTGMPTGSSVPCTFANFMNGTIPGIAMRPDMLQSMIHP